MQISDFQQVWSDFHKEAYGFRPRGEMPNFSLEQWQAEFDRLGKIVNENNKADAERQGQAVNATETLLARLVSYGAPNRQTALRWLHDAHNTDGDNEYLEYQLGVPYGYFNQAA